MITFKAYYYTIIIKVLSHDAAEPWNAPSPSGRPAAIKAFVQNQYAVYAYALCIGFAHRLGWEVLGLGSSVIK